MAACRTLAAVCAVSLLAVVSQGSEPSPARPAATTPSPSAAGNDVLPFQAVEKTLKNGLKVIVVRTGFPNIVSLSRQTYLTLCVEVSPRSSRASTRA